jgi:phosphatidylglycerophosphatase C
MTAKNRVVAAFDFDKTLTRRDTFRMYLRQLVGPASFTVGVLRSAPHLISGFLLGGAHRNAAKEALLRRLMTGWPAAEAEASAQRLATSIIDRWLRPDTCARLAWHRRKGHEIVIVSASFEPYVRIVGHYLGADAVLATRWEVDSHGRLTGRLFGPNVRGPRKAVLLSEFLANQAAFVYVYGNSRGDREMLDLAHLPVLVRRSAISAEPV